MNGLVRLTYDWGLCRGPGPGAGSYLQPHGARGPSQRAYLVIDARLVQSKIHHGRYALRCERVPAAAIPDGAPVFPIYWYPRKRARR